MTETTRQPGEKNDDSLCDTTQRGLDDTEGARGSR